MHRDVNRFSVEHFLPSINIRRNGEGVVNRPIDTVSCFHGAEKVDRYGEPRVLWVLARMPQPATETHRAVFEEIIASTT